ncbi:MAG: DoxX family protein [Candidatus Omnitrophica bacterium]|nr:DoxX family protein [Candidatus Omnitrophota bacterium]
MFLTIRIILGVLFIVSGGEKLLSPLANFIFVIDGYQVVPAALQPAVAWVFPWLELFAGLFILLGLWLRPALMVLGLMSLSLAGIVGQAILRKLPLENCGCFGELVHLPLGGVILIDISVVALTLWCLANIKKASVFSLDEWYARTGV